MSAHTAVDECCRQKENQVSATSAFSPARICRKLAVCRRCVPCRGSDLSGGKCVQPAPDRCTAGAQPPSRRRWPKLRRNSNTYSCRLLCLMPTSAPTRHATACRVLFEPKLVRAACWLLLRRRCGWSRAYLAWLESQAGMHPRYQPVYRGILSLAPANLCPASALSLPDLSLLCQAAGVLAEEPLYPYSSFSAHAGRSL